MQVHASIIHEILKDKDASGPASVQINPRDAVLPIDQNLIRLGTDVLGLYSKLSNSYGTLGADLGLHRFPALMNRLINNEIDFIAFTTAATNLIAELMSQQRLTTTSYPVFIRYTNQNRDWLMIAMLKLKLSVGINQDTLDLNGSLIFDIGNLREAARIDLAKWRTDDQPYLSFIKKGAGSDAESSLYFRHALSCQDYTDAKHNTDIALKAVDEFCISQAWESERRQQARTRTYEYCKDKKASGEPVNMSALSAILNDQDPESFINFVREGAYPVSETFSPHPESYKRFNRLSKRFGTISVAFDVDDIFTGNVSYNVANNSIELLNPPSDLVNEIRKAQGLDANDDGQA